MDKQIVICPDCRGTGERHIMLDWLSYEMRPCSTCGGTGRMYRVITYEKLEATNGTKD